MGVTRHPCRAGRMENHAKSARDGRAPRDNCGCCRPPGWSARSINAATRLTDGRSRWGVDSSARPHVVGCPRGIGHRDGCRLDRLWAACPGAPGLGWWPSRRCLPRCRRHGGAHRFCRWTNPALVGARRHRRHGCGLRARLHRRAISLLDRVAVSLHDGARRGGLGFLVATAADVLLHGANRGTHDEGSRDDSDAPELVTTNAAGQA
jgi:hypothetical protein